MSDRYLPIGSVCTLKSKHKKVMITGYYSVEFNGNLKINDYQGCAYPEGLLLPEFNCTFNHSDIETVDFVGYKNEEYNKFSLLINRLVGKEETPTKDDWVLVSNSSYSKLLFDENGVVVLAEPVAKQKEEQISDIKIDNDVIIDNPFKKEYATELELNFNTNIFEEDKVEENNNTSSSIYKFDENGFVIAEVENTPSNPEVEESEFVSSYKFDENGFVIAEEAGSPAAEEINEETSKPIYKFDENGFVVAEEAGSPAAEEINEETSKPIYKFDENGFLVEVEENQ